VTTVLNQLFTASDLAADRHRALLAEAEAYRLARQAANAAPAPSERKGGRLVRLLRPAPRYASAYEIVSWLKGRSRPRPTS
jgi:hypothetical protein